MKILYHIKQPRGMGAHRFIYDGYKNAWQDLGHEFLPLTDKDNLKQKLIGTKPDLFFASLDYLHFPQDIKTIKKARSLGIKVFMGVGHLFDRDPNILKIMQDPEFADLYYGEKEPECMAHFKKLIGKDYHTIAHAADKLHHFPVAPSKKYAYDIAFLGAKLPMKKWFFDEILIPLTKKYKVGIFGPYWTIKDNFLRAIQAGTRKIKLARTSDFINKLRITLPIEDESLLYSSAKISLNFHERESDGSQPNYILNQRTFKIPACGGFEICDDVPALRKYFKEDEMVIAKLSAKEWFEKIDYYLTHDKEREKIKKAGTKRALKDHTYHNRVEQIIKMYKTI
ncbi:hypothetical protein D4R86_03335 [bacterium]|nr:MAG: hypothetical protein D4R86_03335 [bacterium]